MPNSRHSPRPSNTARAGLSTSVADGHVIGDKVRVKESSHVGARARVVRVRGDTIAVKLDGGDVLVLPFDSITNYSRAARRAWKVMPKRAGRPRAEPRKKMVSLRLDIELIKRLDLAVRKQLTRSRSHVVAAGIAAELDRLAVPRTMSHWSARQQSTKDDLYASKNAN